MGFWKFIFQKEIPMFAETHFSKNGKSHEVLKNYFVLKIMGFIGFLFFGKPTHFLEALLEYIYIYRWKYGLSFFFFSRRKNGLS